MIAEEIKEKLNQFIGMPNDESTRLKIKRMFEQYLKDIKLVVDDPDLIALKKELGIKEDPNIVEFEITVPVNMVEIDINIQTAEKS